MRTQQVEFCTKVKFAVAVDNNFFDEWAFSCQFGETGCMNVLRLPRGGQRLN
jgi:hypothetical protein